MEVSERDRRSLKDLANEASAPAKPKTKSIATPDSSGFVDLAALAATDPDWLEQAVARAKKAHVAIAEKPQTDDELVIDESAMGLPRKRSGARKVAIGIVAFAAIGVAAMALVKTRHEAPAPIVVSAAQVDAPIAAANAQAAVTPAAAPVPTDIPAPPAADEAAASAANDAPAGDNSDTAMELPATPTPGKKGLHGRTARAHGGAAASPAMQVESAKAAPPPKGQPKFLAGIVPASTPAPAAPAAGPGGALGDAMKQASGTHGAAPAAKAAPAPAAPPVANTTGLPDKPPTSAVQSAIKAQLSSARACLHAGDPDMHVTIVFGSSGSPKSIQATGPGASCVQSAFSRTHVPPFAQPTTSAGFTVRPN